MYGSKVKYFSRPKEDLLWQTDFLQRICEIFRPSTTILFIHQTFDTQQKLRLNLRVRLVYVYDHIYGL